MSERAAVCAALLLVLSGTATLIFGGGLLVHLLVDWRVDSQPASSETLYLSLVLSATLVVAALSVNALKRCRSRRPRLGAIAALLGILLAVVSGEIVLRSRLPDWPARALHGVPPKEWAAATSHEVDTGDQPVGLNSWGQRDRQRTRLPLRGSRRIAFIGDSFLEEGAGTPVSLATEQKLAQPQIEVLNLGVSATGPDEYFDRLRGVAAPLGVSQCCLFLFSGNDFVSPARTLKSYWSLASVEPRPGMLTSLGLDGWNHALTRLQRPVIQTWLQGASLAGEEEQRSQALKRASDSEMRSMLLGASGFEGLALSRLAAKLNQPESEAFFKILRNPDAGKFRSYYLGDALRASADETWTWEPNSEIVAWQWTERAAQFCRRHSIRLTIVLIPEAFQVDDQMWEGWLPLADMRRCTAPCREAAQRYLERARSAGLEVIDLHQDLKGSRGTYLNLDGHWSEKGVELVSAVLAKHLSAGQPATGAVAHEP